LLFEELGLKVGHHWLYHQLKAALHHIRQLMRGEPDAVIGDS
jgi:hypothetical protein